MDALLRLNRQIKRVSIKKKIGFIWVFKSDYNLNEI